MYVDLLKVLSSFIYIYFLLIKALSIVRPNLFKVGHFFLFYFPNELFTFALNYMTLFVACGSLAVLKGGCLFVLSSSQNDWV